MRLLKIKNLKWGRRRRSLTRCRGTYQIRKRTYIWANGLPLDKDWKWSWKSSRAYEQAVGRGVGKGKWQRAKPSIVWHRQAPCLTYNVRRGREPLNTAPFLWKILIVDNMLAHNWILPHIISKFQTDCKAQSLPKCHPPTWDTICYMDLTWIWSQANALQPLGQALL